MKVLLYADFRSPHARGWRKGLEDVGIHVISLSSEVEDQTINPFRSASVGLTSNPSNPKDFLSRTRSKVAVFLASSNSLVAKLLRKAAEVQFLHSLLFMLRRHALVARLKKTALETQPDVIHSLRIPYESVTVLFSKLEIPWVVSTWGADFVPQAAQDPLLRRWTREVLSTADAIQYDAKVDHQRALGYGFSAAKPNLYAAGNFGVDTDLFYREPSEKNFIVYPRKIAPTVNYWGFIEAVQLLLPLCDKTFVGIGLLPLQNQIYSAYPELNTDRLILTDALDQDSYARYIRQAEIVVSPGYTDGTPNSLLEAISAGAKVVVGSLPHLRDMDSEHSMGLFFIDATQSQSIADGVIAALEEPDMTPILPLEMTRTHNGTKIRGFYESAIKAHITPYGV